MKTRFAIIVTVAVILMGTVSAVLYISPLEFPSPSPSPSTGHTLEETVFNTFDSKEINDITPDCKSVVMRHSEATDVVILFHGITNCPYQFREVADHLYDAGYNVLIPRMPGHGYKDKMTDALAYSTPDQLLKYAEDAMVVAKQLGQHIHIIGLSAGGTLALWEGVQHHIDSVLVIAPLMYPSGFDVWLRDPIIRYTELMPNEFRWWDESKRDNLPGSPYSYPRYSSKSMGAFMHIAHDAENNILQNSRNNQKTIINLLINAGDPALHMAPLKI